MVSALSRLTFVGVSLLTGCASHVDAPRAASTTPVAEPVPVPPDTSSEAAFTESARTELARIEPTWTTTLGNEALTLQVKARGQELQLGLGRIWDYCRSGVTDCDLAMHAYLESASVALKEAAAPAPAAAEQLMPAVRGRDAGEAYLAKSPDGLVQAFVGDLFVATMLDTEHAARLVSPDLLTELKMTALEARARALENLRKAQPLPTVQVRDLDPQTIGQFAPHFYTSSLLLLDDEWAKISAKYEGKLLVSVPAAETLLYVDGRDPMALSVLRGLAQQMYDRAERRLSPAVLTWTKEGWAVVPEQNAP